MPLRPIAEDDLEYFEDQDREGDVLILDNTERPKKHIGGINLKKQVGRKGLFDDDGLDDEDLDYDARVQAALALDPDEMFKIKKKKVPMLVNMKKQTGRPKTPEMSDDDGIEYNPDLEKP